MHLQTNVQDWPRALLAMPDWSSIKAVNNAGILRDAVNLWNAAGRRRERLFTIYRYHDYDDRLITTDSEIQREHWRRQFFKFIDGTYLREFAPFVGGVEELNEYTDTRFATDESLLAPALASARAAVHVWNTEFRGRIVNSPDGGRGLVPDACRLILCNSPVGNRVPRQYYELAVAEDCILGQHPYMKILKKVRDPECFRFHSGRWNFEEQEYGIKPVHAFTECGPYKNTADGWRSPDVLDGDEPLMVRYYADWFVEMQGTAAYREGRILGHNWFTSGDDVKWKWYNLETPNLLAIAQAARDHWKPGAWNQTVPPIPPPQENPMTEEERRTVRAVIAQLQTAAISLDALLAPPPWWQAWPAGVISPPRPLAIPNRVMTFLHDNGTPFSPQPLTRPVTWTMLVTERRGNLLRVLDQAGTDQDFYVRAEDVAPA